MEARLQAEEALETAAVTSWETREIETGCRRSAAATGMNAVIRGKALAELVHVFALLKRENAPGGV